MLEIAIMVEGQNGLNWERWQRLAIAVEALGFAGLFRSDHYTNANPPDMDSLELWVSLTWLASHTQRIQFGPLVTPVSFRNPSMTARMAAAVDDLSQGRLVLGVGAGWQEREHTNYGWELLDKDERFARFTEGLEVISRMLKSDSPFDYEGRYFRLQEAILLPRPEHPGGPPILVGGNGERRTLPLAAHYADEWNAVYLTAVGEFPGKALAGIATGVNFVMVSIGAVVGPPLFGYIVDRTSGYAESWLFTSLCMAAVAFLSLIQKKERLATQ